MTDDRRIPKEMMIRMYSGMLSIRMFEDKVAELYPEQEMKCPVHLCTGQEAIAVGVCLNLRKDDYVFSNHRGHGHCLAKGLGMKPLMAELYGKTTGCSSGRGGSMHLVDIENGILGTTAIVAGGIPIAVGAALASRMKGEDRVAAVFFGDGACDEGTFHESVNFAALKKLPVVFVCENNFYATNSHQGARRSGSGIAEAASAFNATGVTVDGNDVMAIYDAARSAVSRAREGKGPALIEARTYRWKGHVGPEEDHEKGLRPKEELLYWKDRCPVKGFKEFLLRENILTGKDIEDIAEAVDREINEAVAFAIESPLPDASILLKDVYREQG